MMNMVLRRIKSIIAWILALGAVFLLAYGAAALGGVV